MHDGALFFYLRIKNLVTGTGNPEQGFLGNKS